MRNLLYSFSLLLTFILFSPAISSPVYANSGGEGDSYSREELYAIFSACEKQFCETAEALYLDYEAGELKVNKVGAGTYEVKSLTTTGPGGGGSILIVLTDF